MVASPRKKSKISLSTWGPRGTAGLVEEWESRIPLREQKQQSRRKTAVSSNRSTDASADNKDSKK